MDQKRQKMIEQCKKKLLQVKQERVNGMQRLRSVLESEIQGDEADMASSLEYQHSSLLQREKFLRDLQEIDAALSRIETNNYGFCEETGDPIDENRLLAIPWTRLSIEGAEIRERNFKRYA